MRKAPINYAAKRRKSRQIERARASEAGANRVSGIPQDASIMKDCTISDCHTGIELGPGAALQSTGLILENNVVGIENRGGYFHGPDTVIT